jgi:hypothetical protein
LDGRVSSTQTLDLAKLPSSLRSLNIQKLPVSPQAGHQLMALTSLRATVFDAFQPPWRSARQDAMLELPEHLLPFPILPASLLHVQLEVNFQAYNQGQWSSASFSAMFAALPPSLLSLSVTAVSTYSRGTCDLSFRSSDLTLAHLTALTQLKLDVDFGTVNTRFLTSLPQSLRALEISRSCLPSYSWLARLTQLTRVVLGRPWQGSSRATQPADALRSLPALRDLSFGAQQNMSGANPLQSSFRPLLQRLWRLQLTTVPCFLYPGAGSLLELQHATQLTALKFVLHYHLLPELPAALAPLTCLEELDIALSLFCMPVGCGQGVCPPASVATQLGAILSSMPLRTLKLFAVDQQHEPPPDWLIDDSWKNKLLESCSEHVRRLHPFEARQHDLWCSAVTSAGCSLGPCNCS